KDACDEAITVRTYLYPDTCAPQIHFRQEALKYLLDMELPVGGQPGCNRTRQSLLHDDRGAPGCVARLRVDRIFRKDVFAGHRWNARAISPFASKIPVAGR